MLQGHLREKMGVEDTVEEYAKPEALLNVRMRVAEGQAHTALIKIPYIWGAQDGSVRSEAKISSPNHI